MDPTRKIDFNSSYQTDTIKEEEEINNTKVIDALIAGAKTGAIAAVATFFAALGTGAVIAFVAAIAVGTVVTLIATIVDFRNKLRNEKLAAKEAAELKARAEKIKQDNLLDFLEAPAKIKAALEKFDGTNKRQVYIDLLRANANLDDVQLKELYKPYIDKYPNDLFVFNSSTEGELNK